MPLVFAVLLIIVLWTSGVKNIRESKESKEREDWGHRKTNARKENLLACEYYYTVEGATQEQAIAYSHRKIRELGYQPCLTDRHYFTGGEIVFWYSELAKQYQKDNRTLPIKSMLIDEYTILHANSYSVQKRLCNARTSYVAKNLPIPKTRAVFGNYDLGEYEDYEHDAIYSEWPTSWMNWLDEDLKGYAFAKFKTGDEVVHKTLGAGEVINVYFSEDRKNTFYVVKLEETKKTITVDGSKNQLEKM